VSIYEKDISARVKEAPCAVSSVQDIKLDRIRESSSNPRRAFDEGKLRESADNIKLHGVLQAILVRPAPDGAEGTYELVAGARRFRASRLAGKNTIPANVRDLTDAECREIQLIENLQRDDIHELDEGRRRYRLSLLDGAEARFLHRRNNRRAGCQESIVRKRSRFSDRPNSRHANCVLRGQAHSPVAELAFS
jgi:ParB-like nuclease domain